MGENENFEAEALAKVRENHVWLNAFQCVRPTEEFEREVGAAVLRMFRDPENLIQSEKWLIESERSLIIRFNKS